MKPTQTPSDKALGGDTFKHPAFGQISVSRVSGRKSGAIYCSEVEANSFVSVAISGSVLTRQISNDWVFPRDQKIEIHMSEAQWATFVSAMNVGSGTPCTIARIGSEAIPDIDWGEDRSNRFGIEMGETLAAALEGVEALASAIQDRPMTKKTRLELLTKLDRVRNNVSGNVQFVADQFEEHVEKSVEAAKAEVHGYLTATASDRGALNEGLGSRGLVAAKVACNDCELEDCQCPSMK